MFNEELRSFIDYLVSSAKSCSDLTKFIALHCLKDYNVVSLYVGIIKEDGCIHRIGGFGLDELVVGKWEKIPLEIDLPITKSVKTSEYIYLDDKETLIKEFSYSQLLPLQTLSWNACLAVPYVPNGILFIGFKSKIDLDDHLSNFLETLLKLIIFSDSFYFEYEEKAENKKFKLNTEESGRFTNRQNLIFEMMKKGLTNKLIANELGYSESLVRQETVKIFRKLNVTGRKQILELG